MDTNNILQSLANLRDSLEAIESAKQQVQNNVAAYDKVRQQLADTSTSISQILSDFNTLSHSMSETEDTVKNEIHTATKAILKTLRDKAVSISQESQSIVETLRTTTDAINTELANYVQEAIERINTSTIQSKEDITTGLHGIHEDFKVALETSIKDIQKEHGKLESVLDKTQAEFEEKLNSQINLLSVAVSDHITKLEGLRNDFRTQVKKLEKGNENLESNISSIIGEVDKKIDGLLPKIAYLFDEIKGQTSSISADLRNQTNALSTEIKEGSNTTVNEIKTLSTTFKNDLKGHNDASKRRAEKIDGRLDEEFKNLKAELEELKAENRKNRITTVIGFILLAIPLILMIFKLFK